MWQKIKNIYHLFNAFLANVWFGFPSKHLTVIGVTGTDGKTTTVSLIYHILHTAGYSASMISSVGAIIGGKEYDVGFHVTTPSPWALQRFIKKTLNARGPALPAEALAKAGPAARSSKGAPSSLSSSNEDARLWTPPLASPAFGIHPNNYLVLETTSHAIDQNRIWGIPFDIGVLTNVTHEHLDYHKTYENYVNTKARLLKMARVAVVNRDDNSYELISKVKSQKSKVQFKSKKFVTYGMRGNTDINPKSFPFKTNLIGEFNKYNVLAAVAVCRELGIRDQVIRKAILTFKPPIGREEIVCKNPFTVMVDFAHTPNAFGEILSALKNPPSPRLRRTRGRLIHVFGAAGERDASKRPLMGKVSSKYSDVIILTAEDPRSESVEKIMEEIELGIQKSKVKSQNYSSKVKNKVARNTILKIPNRRDAINTAIKMAKRGDFVLITGKSHEKSMNYGKGEEPWDEFGTVEMALSYLRK